MAASAVDTVSTQCRYSVDTISVYTMINSWRYKHVVDDVSAMIIMIISLLPYLNRCDFVSKDEDQE